MFTKFNQNDDLSTMTDDELHQKLKKVDTFIENQKKSIEICDGSGIMPEYMSEALLSFYISEKNAVEKEIEQRTQSDSKIEKQFK